MDLPIGVGPFLFSPIYKYHINLKDFLNINLIGLTLIKKIGREDIEILHKL